LCEWSRRNARRGVDACGGESNAGWGGGGGAKRAGWGDGRGGKERGLYWCLKERRLREWWWWETLVDSGLHDRGVDGALRWPRGYGKHSELLSMSTHRGRRWVRGRQTSPAILLFLFTRDCGHHHNSPHFTVSKTIAIVCAG